MGLRDLWRGLQGKQPPKATTETGPKIDRTIFWSNPWLRSRTRRGVWNELEKMDKDEAIIARGLDVLTRFAITFSDGAWNDTDAVGFRIESPNSQEVDILEPVVRMLQRSSFERVRYTAKFGDVFQEVVVEPSSLEVVNHKLFPYSYQIERNEDRFASLMTGDPNEAMRTRRHGLAAFEQTDDWGNMIAAFWNYQITQGSFGVKQGLRYAEPLLGPIISVYKRLRAVEDGLAISRLTRSWPQRIVPVPMPEGIEPEEAKERIRTMREQMGVETTVPYDTDAGEFYIRSTETPEAVDTTIFYPLLYTEDGRTIEAKIENLSADNPNLNNIEDIYLMLRRVLCAITVPADSLNLAVGQRSFIDKVSPEKREAFLYVVCAMQAADRLVLQQVLDTQLLLQGRNPLKAKYRIVQPRINPREAEVSVNIDVKRANTAAIWAKLGVPREIIGNRILQLAPSDLDKWVKSGGEVVPAGTTPEKQVEVWREGAQMQLVGGS